MLGRSVHPIRSLCLSGQSGVTCHHMVEDLPTCGGIPLEILNAPVTVVVGFA